MTDAKQIESFMLIADSADSLEEYLHSNSGTTDDWPIDLVARSKEDAEMLAGLLTKLRDALKPYRKTKSTPPQSSDSPPSSPSSGAGS